MISQVIRIQIENTLINIAFGRVHSGTNSFNLLGRSKRWDTLAFLVTECISIFYNCLSIDYQKNGLTCNQM